MRYRAEIDGLRAVAVIPVILFHAGFNVFSGGFAGVDIFFVISGYLITTIILSELKDGKFRITTFYERRARRILPALFVVLAACLPAAWLWLLPWDMQNFSQSLTAVAGFYSNIQFWKMSGYFESAAELRPLLHTWSLAVEEQYYLFFPIFLILAWRLGRRFIVALLIIAGGVSLALAQWASSANPEAGFYLLPTRGWELLIGAFVAFYYAWESRPVLSDTQNQILSAIGFGLLLVSLFLFDKHTPFPSLYTLVPTIGAGLIILSATQATLVGKLLGNRVFVGIGLISYSAYLWHQPLLAFARHESFDEPSRLVFAGLILATLGLAWLTWKYVETPFRNREVISRAQIFTFSIVGSLIVAAAGYAGRLDHGHRSRFSPERQEFLSYFENGYPDYKYFRRTNYYENFRIECDFFDIPKELEGHPTQQPKAISPSCTTRDPGKKHAVFVWGDSHAQHLYSGLKENLPSDWQILQVASSACKPSLAFDKNSRNYCPHSNAFAYQAIVETKPDVVLVAQEGGHDLAFMQQLSERLRQEGVGRVVFLGPIPHWLKGGLPSVVAYKLLGETPRFSTVGLDLGVRDRDDALKQAFRQTPQTRYLSLFDYFCRQEGCRVYYGDDVKTGITSYDYAHMTRLASRHLSKDVLVPALLETETAPPDAPLRLSKR